MKVALYAHVGTTDEDADLELRELREYAARRGWAIAVEFVDRGWSHTRGRRRELSRLMADARLRRFDTVICWTLTRIVRSPVNAASFIYELCSRGIRILSVSEGFDIDQANPTSQPLLHFLAEIAQFERDLIRERIAAGMKSARAKGRQIGRPRRLFDRKRVLDLRANGLSYAEIAVNLGIGIGTVARVCAALSTKLPG